MAFNSPVPLHSSRSILQTLANSPTRALTFIIVGHLLAWSLISWLTVFNLSRYADMYELYAWGSFPQRGSDKHPPLLAWITGAWFQLFPRQDWAFHLLAVTNTTVAILLMTCLAREILKEHPERTHLAFLVAAFCALSLTYGNMGLKLNMNSILLPLWPLVTWMFIRAIKKPSFLNALLLGLAATLSILGKYFSGILLLSLFIISLSTPTGRQWYRRPTPYLALLICVIALLPHILWLLDHHFATIEYVVEQSKRQFEALRLLRFPAMLVAVILLALLVFWFVGRPWRSIKERSAWYRPILMLVFLPLVLVLVIGTLLQTLLSTPWIIPLGFAIPIALVLSYQSSQDPALLRLRLLRSVLIYWLLAFIVSACNTAYQSIQGPWYFYAPRQELAKIIASHSFKPSWAAGSWHYTTALSFYDHDKRIRAIPNLPNKVGSQAETPEDWTQQPGVVIYLDFHHAEYEAAEQWLHQHGFIVKREHVTAIRQGWQFRKNYPVGFILLWACPETNQSCQTADK